MMLKANGMVVARCRLGINLTFTAFWARARVQNNVRGCFALAKGWGVKFLQDFPYFVIPQWLRGNQ
jgi:N-acetylglutamate synthase-like GNAT family acetyltransferase